MVQSNIRVGTIKDVSGDVNIAGGDIVTGYTAEQVTLLLDQIRTTFRPKPFDGRSPYKGLNVFEEEDAGLFYGREKVVKSLVSRVKESRTVFITGPSGCGKSSLVRAGLIPALKQGAVKTLHSEHWLYETMKPGRDPFSELARVAASFSGTLNAGEDIRTKGKSDATILAQWCRVALKGNYEKRIVLLVDQFEEIFTQVSQESERKAFLDLLTHAATDEIERLIVLFAMRSDFVSYCARYPILNALLNQQFVHIGTMQSDELVNSIAQPALRLGLHIDPDLIAQIINDMGGEPGALPLMQFALNDLFDAEQAKGGMIALTREAYLQRGGIHKSLEHHADSAFAKLGESEQSLARTIFSSMVEIGQGTQDTRRTALFDELVPADQKAEEVRAVVQCLADARLITTDEQAGKLTATIAHEKLIDAWPWLKRLVNENHDVIALQNEIANDAKEWEAHKRDASYLYRGARLANAREKLESRKILLSELAQQFIETGAQTFIDELATSQKRTNLLRRRSVYLSMALIVALIAVGFAVFFGIQSRLQAEISHTGELAAESVAIRSRDFQVSMLLGLEAFNALDTDQTRGVLMDNAYSNPKLQAYLSRHNKDVSSVAFSPDGKMLASGSGDSTIILWDVGTRQPIGQPLSGHNSDVLSVAFSPDGKTLASGSTDNTIILWDVDTRQPNGRPLTGHADWVRSVAFSPDGKMLASGSYDNTIILWDVGSRRPIGQPLSGHIDSVRSVAFSPDGKWLVSGSCGNLNSEGVCTEGEIILWDVATRQPIGEPLRGHGSRIRSVAFSPDGVTLASGSEDSTIILWDMRTQQPIGQPLKSHTSDVTSLAFSPDGVTLASGSGDNTIILWDVVTRQPIGQPLIGHRDWVISVAFSPDGKWLASGGWDGNVILWDVAARYSISQPLNGHTAWVSSIDFSPDGKTLASGSGDHTIILWDVETRQPIGQPLRGHSSSVSTITFSPDGKKLASVGCAMMDSGGACSDGEIILWDVGTGQPIGPPLRGRVDSTTDLAFSPDGKTLATSSEDFTIILWDVKTGQPFGEPLVGHRDWVTSISFSPDGKTLASGSCGKANSEGFCIEGKIFLWNMDSRQPIGQPLGGHRDWVTSVAFSPDGEMLASGSEDNTIILWDVNTEQPIGQPLSGHRDWVNSVAFSPDGKMLASGSSDNTIILWDVGTGQPIGQPLSGHRDWVSNVTFSPDGKTLASGSGDSTILLWEMNPSSWVQETCQRVGRNFTYAEWRQYYPDEAYRKTCEELPKHMSYYRGIAEQTLSDSDDSWRIQNALDRVRMEMEKDNSFAEDSAGESLNIVEELISEKIFTDMRYRNWQEALDLLGQAKAYDSLFVSTMKKIKDPDSLNSLCWDGSVNGFAEQVIEYCERAVAFDASDPGIRDSRGLARALTGDYAGAIDDFQFFVDHGADRGLNESLIQQRRGWIADLKAGINPFTPDVLEELKGQ